MSNGADAIRKFSDRLNELSPDTLGSYVKKAADDLSHQGYTYGAESDSEHGSWKAAAKAEREVDKRSKGIHTATNKLVKKSRKDNINELSPDTLHSYRQKAAQDIKSKYAQVGHPSQLPDEVRFGPTGTGGTVGRARKMGLAAQKLRAKGQVPASTTQSVKTAESLMKKYKSIDS